MKYKWTFMRKHMFIREKITVAIMTYEVRTFWWPSWNDLVSHWCLYNNRILHGRLEIRKFSSCVEKHFMSECSEWVKHFSILEDKFCISAVMKYPLFFKLWLPGWNLRKIRFVAIILLSWSTPHLELPIRPGFSVTGAPAGAPLHLQRAIFLVNK